MSNTKTNTRDRSQRVFEDHVVKMARTGEAPDFRKLMSDLTCPEQLMKNSSNYNVVRKVFWKIATEMSKDEEPIEGLDEALKKRFTAKKDQNGKPKTQNKSNKAMQKKQGAMFGKQNAKTPRMQKRNMDLAKTVMNLEKMNKILASRVQSLNDKLRSMLEKTTTSAKPNSSRSVSPTPNKKTSSPNGSRPQSASRRDRPQSAPRDRSPSRKN